MILLAALSLGSGCMATHSPDLPPETLQREIREGNLIEAGDSVVLTTGSGRVQIDVTEVTPEVVRGDGASVAIEEIVTLGNRRLSVARTVGLVATSAVGFAILVMLAAPL